MVLSDGQARQMDINHRRGQAFVSHYGLEHPDVSTYSAILGGEGVPECVRSQLRALEAGTLKDPAKRVLDSPVG